MTNQHPNLAPQTQYVYQYTRNFYGPFAASRARKFGRELAHMIRDTFFYGGNLDRTQDHEIQRGMRLEYETGTSAGSARVHINYGAIPMVSDIPVCVNTRKMDNTLDVILRCEDLIPQPNFPKVIVRSLPQGTSPLPIYEKKPELTARSR